VAVSASGYVRRASDDRALAERPTSRAASLGLRADLGGGWIAGVSGGAVDRGADADPDPTWGASLAAPAWWPVAAAVAWRHGVLDATAVLIERGVTTDEVSASVTAQLGSAVRLEAGASLARYEGTDTNDRELARLGLEFRPSTWSRVRPRVTAFRFDHRAGEGYFDPDFYGLGEVGIGVERYRGAWSFSGEVAPGAQQVGSDGDVQGALALRARLGYTVGPAREVAASFAFSNLGIERFEAASAGYRYQAVVLSIGWGF
jgi:hypothetical protein